jgi:hypothetical protein
MAESFSSGHNDEQLVRYLLDLLPEDEAERLDEMSIADDEVAWRLREAEDSLVDAYIDGALTGETLARFESIYLTSPRRRDRVAFAREFRRVTSASPEPVQVAAATAIATPEPAPAVRVPIPPASASGRRGLFIWKLALVPAALAIACGVLLFQQARLRQSVDDLQNRNAALDQRAHGLEEQLQQERSARAALVAAAAPTTITSGTSSQGALATATDADRAAAAALPALVLLPETRAVGAMAVLDVPMSTVYAKFELRLESNDFPEYQVALKDPATNRAFWSTSWITAMLSGKVPTLAVLVPARELKAQHYSFDVVGRRPGGHTELVASYTFQRLPR